MALEKTEREAAQKNIAENRKAFHDYHILETFETGLVLRGTEVKSIREGNVNLRDSFARIENGKCLSTVFTSSRTAIGGTPITSRCGPVSSCSTRTRSAN